MVVDDMDALPPAVSGVTPAGPGMADDEGAAEKRLDAIIIEVDAQTPTDEKWARSAATANPPVRVTGTTISVKSVSPEANLRFDGAPLRQRLQVYLLRLNRRRPLLVASGNSQVDEAPVVPNACEVAAAAQDQRLCNRGLQMPVLRFHRPILVGLTTVVAAGVHAVMADKGIMALGHILALIGGQVAESG